MLLFLVVVLSCVSRTLARALISDVLIFGSRKETLTIRSFSQVLPRLRLLSHQISHCCTIRLYWMTRYLGYLQEFMSLESPARRAAKRALISAVSITDSMASTALSAFNEEAGRRATVAGTIADQLVIAADVRPKKFRTKWQRAIYEGPTARKDAEAAERDRWTQLLANLLRSTDTPMGKMIRESPSNIQLLGGGRRAGTLRSRVRSVQKFLGWLVASHGISFPVHWRQLTEYLQVRYSEPCVRGALKLVHSSYIFLQEVAGVEDKLTDSAMYAVSLKELMSQASPERPPRQAPRFPTILLAAFEDTVLSADTPVFVRVLSWWLLVQSWGTLRSMIIVGCCLAISLCLRRVCKPGSPGLRFQVPTSTSTSEL